MLNWAITFLVIGLIAGALGLFGVAGAATQIAWILFVVFMVLFLVSLFVGRRPRVCVNFQLARRRRTVTLAARRLQWGGLPVTTGRVYDAPGQSQPMAGN